MVLQKVLWCETRSGSSFEESLLLNSRLLFGSVESEFLFWISDVTFCLFSCSLLVTRAVDAASTCDALEKKGKSTQKNAKLEQSLAHSPAKLKHITQRRQKKVTTIVKVTASGMTGLSLSSHSALVSQEKGHFLQKKEESVFGKFILLPFFKRKRIQE